MLLAQAQQFLGAGEVVGQHGVVLVQLAAGGLLGIDHEAAADRIVGVAMQHAAVDAKSRQGHGIGVIGQVLVEQQHVARPVEGHRHIAVDQQLAAGEQRRDTWLDLRRVDLVRPVAHQAHDHRPVAAVTDPGGRQRAIQAHFHAAYPRQQAPLAQRADKQRGSAHGADGMRAGRPDTDLEQIEHTDSHNDLLQAFPRCGHHRDLRKAQESHTDAFVSKAVRPAIEGPNGCRRIASKLAPALPASRCDACSSVSDPMRRQRPAFGAMIRRPCPASSRPSRQAHGQKPRWDPSLAIWISR
ncbi:hypothetical protein D9M68_668580 [compost metagenome]